MIEPNTFQLPNLVVDEYLATMPQAALRCYLLIIRKTKGWQKNKDRISRSQFEEYTGLPKSTVYEGLKWLEQNGLIQRHKGETQNQITEYQVSGPPDTGSEGVRPTGIRCPAHRNQVSGPPEQQKPLNTKPTNTKGKREEKQTGPEQWESRGKARSTSSALYDRFLELYRVSPSNKARCREEWFRERLDWGYSCETIGERIIAALENQHATCYRFRLAKFVPKPEEYLRQEQWTDKIVPLKEQPKKTASAAPDRSGALAMIRNKSRQSRTIEGELSS